MTLRIGRANIERIYKLLAFTDVDYDSERASSGRKLYVRYANMPCKASIKQTFGESLSGVSDISIKEAFSSCHWSPLLRQSDGQPDRPSVITQDPSPAPQNNPGLESTWVTQRA